MNTQHIKDALKEFPVGGESKTSMKHKHIRDRIAEVVKNVAPDTKLPTMRELAEIFKTTQPSLMKATNALINEGILYSKPRSGIFVKGGAGNQKSVIEPGITAGSLTREITFGCSKLLPFQRRFWLEVISDFEREHRYLKIRLAEAAPGSALSNQDISEASFGNPKLHRDNFSDYMEISGFSGVESGHLFPVYLNYPVLFINKNLQAKHKFEFSRLASFSERFASLRAAFERRHLLNPGTHCFINIIQPATVLGNRGFEITKLMHQMKRNGLGAVAELGSPLKQIVGILRETRDQDPVTVSGIPMNYFMSGECLFYLGWNYQSGYLKGLDLDFEWTAVPFRSCDEKVSGLPFTIAVRRETPYAVECLRFLKHLHSEKCQRLASELMGAPVQNIKGMNPFSLLPGTESADCTEVSVPVYGSQDDLYLFYSVINDEIWRTIDTGTSDMDKVLMNMVELGRTYIKSGKNPAKAA